MKTIALVSLKGGTGRTTLAAGIATALNQPYRECMAVDLDPQSSLGCHFGLAPDEPMGLAWPQLTASHVDDLRRRVRSKVPFVPFGRSTDEELRGLERKLADPARLHARLTELLPPGCDLAVLDVPAGRSPWLSAALSVADVVLSVVLADAASLATLPALERLMADVRGELHPAWTVVNQTDGTRSLARDAALAVDALVGGRRVPVAIPADDAVREAVARQRTVIDEAVASQATAAIWSLATWLESAIAGEDGKAPAGRVVVMAGAR